MKKIILAVILLAAAGGGIYYLLEKKTVNGDFKQEQIIGKWKIDSMVAKNDTSALMLALIATLDSNMLNYDYDFRKEGIVVRYFNDSMQKDTGRYELTKDRRLIWIEEGDSARDSLTVKKLNQNSLILKAEDSTIIYLKKVK